MTSVVESLNQWSAVWAAVVWAVVWQSTLVAAGVAGLAWLLRRSSPAVRYWLWQIVALKLLVMPLWSLAVPLPDFWSGSPNEPAEVSQIGLPDHVGPGTAAAPIEIPLAGAGGAAGPAPTARTWLQKLGWQTWLFAAWVVGAAWQIGVIVRQRVRLARVLHEALPPESPVTKLVGELAARLGLTRPPRVLVSAADASPFVCGMRRAVLVLPKGMLGSLDEAQLRQVLLHELAHVKRHDLAWGWISEVTRIVYFFHPVAHLASYRIRLERELACDQLAMALSGTDAAAYANTLVQVVSRSLEPAALRAAAATSAGLAGEALPAEDQHLNRSNSHA